MLSGYFRARLQLLEADRVLLEVIVIEQILGGEQVDPRHGERTVRARPGRNVPIGMFGGARFVGADYHYLRTVVLRALDERPVMQVGRQGIARPDDDVPRAHEALRIHTAGGSEAALHDLQTGFLFGYDEDSSERTVHALIPASHSSAVSRGAMFSGSGMAARRRAKQRAGSPPAWMSLERQSRLATNSIATEFRQ